MSSPAYFDVCSATSTAHVYQDVVVKAIQTGQDDENDDTFVAWEGLYKNCAMNKDKPAMYSVGISKLKLSSSCQKSKQGLVTDTIGFAGCTDLVRIVHQGSHGRDAIVPYGGMSLVTESTENQVFFLSLIRRVNMRGASSQQQVRYEFWAFPEGGLDDNHFVASKGQRLLASNVDSSFFDQNNQDTVYGESPFTQYHRNSQGQLDHVCHSAMDQGIICFPVVLENRVSTPILSISGDPEFVLSNESMKEFCYGDESIRNSRQNKASVLGFEVDWNLSDGLPNEISFDCLTSKDTVRHGAVNRFGDISVLEE